MRPRITKPKLIQSTISRKRYKIAKLSNKTIERAQQRNKRSLYLKDNGRSIYIDSSVA